MAKRSPIEKLTPKQEVATWERAFGKPVSSLHSLTTRLETLALNLHALDQTYPMLAGLTLPAEVRAVLFTARTLVDPETEL